MRRENSFGKHGPIPTARPTSIASNTIDVSKPVTVAAASIPSARVASELTTVEVTKLDDQTTASIKSEPSNWVIQIAAAGTRSGASEVLESARKRVPSELGNRETYIESVVKNGVTLYRARFSGFAGKTDARETCKALKQKKITCLALTS